MIGKETISFIEEEEKAILLSKQFVGELFSESENIIKIVSFDENEIEDICSVYTFESENQAYKILSKFDFHLTKKMTLLKELEIDSNAKLALYLYKSRRIQKYVLSLIYDSWKRYRLEMYNDFVLKHRIVS